MRNHQSIQSPDYSPAVHLKILILSHSFSPEIGGIESISEILATAFTKAGHEVHVATWTNDDTETAFPFVVIRKPSIGTLFKEHAWAHIVFENNPCLRLGWMGLFFKRKSIIAIQTWISRMDGGIGLQDRLKFAFLKRARFIIACSNAIRNKYAPSSYVIGNPYKEQMFKQVPNIAKTADFIFLGRLVSDKGADIMIQALYQLLNTEAGQASIPLNLSLTIAGDGPDREYLKYMASELGLQNNIVFTGSLTGEALVKCLNQHKYIVVPSRWEEPFGIVALEGMACGCLPIVSNCGGLPDAVGGAGLLFKQGDVDALVCCIKEILKNPEHEKRMRISAAAHLSSFHSSEVSKRYLSLFERVYLNNAV